MTTTVTVFVNGQYRATVEQTFASGGTETTTIEGNYNGGTGSRSFHLAHPAESTFKITETYVPDDERVPAVDEAAKVDAAAEASGSDHDESDEDENDGDDDE